jgi:hypothetical protein
VVSFDYMGFVGFWLGGIEFGRRGRFGSDLFGWDMICQVTSSYALAEEVSKI